MTNKELKKQKTLSEKRKIDNELAEKGINPYLVIDGETTGSLEKERKRTAAKKSEGENNGN